MAKIGAWQVLAAGAAVVGLGVGFLLGGRGGSGATPATFANVASGSPTAGSGGPGISVVGTGTVSGTPDTLKAVLGVQVVQPTVSQALDEANRTAAAVQAVLTQRGVADKDLQTSGVSVQPQYSYENNKQSVTGYQVDENLSVTLRDLKTAGATISAAAEAGGDATRVSSVTLDLSDTGKLVTAAREAAFKEARDKAQQYARAAGVDLGEVAGISEQIATPPAQPQVFATAAAGASDKIAAVPVAAGSQDVVVTVNVTFGIG